MIETRDMKKICVGILGLGTVGNGVANLLDEQRELIKRRLGVEVCVSKIADRSIFTKNKTARGVAAENLGTDFEAVIDAPEVHVVAELIGGTDDARRHILRAIRDEKAGGHREQGGARRPRGGDIRRGGEGGLSAGFRGVCRGRHSDNQKLTRGFRGG